jgi:hypothetical protein
MKNLIGNLSTYLAAGILMAFGMIYLLRSSFMPYHSEAISLKWDEVEPATQILLLALMRATSGGFIGLAFAIAFLQYKFATTKISWIPGLILVLGTISMLCSACATILIITKTPGNPPLNAVITGEIFIIIGFVFNRKFRFKVDK